MIEVSLVILSLILAANYSQQDKVDYKPYNFQEEIARSEKTRVHELNYQEQSRHNYKY